MVIVLAPVVDKICESFKHNPLKRSHYKSTFLYPMGIYNEFIDNLSKFESELGGGQHGCVCVAMAKQQYILHLNNSFVPLRKLGRSPAYPLKPMHQDILAAVLQYHNNVYEYQLVKNMNSALKKIVVVAIKKKCIKGAKDMVMGYVNKYFRELMDWIYLWYGHITPRDLILKQEGMQETYNFKYPLRSCWDRKRWENKSH